MSDATPQNWISEVRDKPDDATLAKSEEKLLQLIMSSMAS